MSNSVIQTNPLREGLSSRAMPEPCTLVIFGATGDLTHRKLVPALYNLAADGALPPAISVVGFARRDKSDEVFRGELEEAARKHSRQSIHEELWGSFAAAICYHRSGFDDLAGYESLAERLAGMDAARGTRGNRLFYLAAAPDNFMTRSLAGRSALMGARSVRAAYRAERAAPPPAAAVAPTSAPVASTPASRKGTRSAPRTTPCSRS